MVKPAAAVSSGRYVPPDGGHACPHHGRRPRRAFEAAHRPSLQTRDAVRRQVPHHRLRSVQLRELGHPPALSADPVQGALADSARSARVGATCAASSASSSRCSPRSSSSARHVVPRHRQLAFIRTSTCVRRPRARAGADPRRRPCLQDGLRSAAGVSRGEGRRYHRGRGGSAARAKRAQFGVHDGGSNPTASPRFAEKPARSRSDARDGTDVALASMGIYVFNAGLLDKLLTARCGQRPDSPHDFGRNIIPDARRHADMCSPIRSRTSSHARRTTGAMSAPWMRTTKPTWSWCGWTPNSISTTRQWPIWTYQRQAPPAKFVLDEECRRGMAVNSLVSGGCIVSRRQM